MNPSFTATVEWRRGDAKFTDKKYSRAHTWRFDGGAVVPGSSSPHSVPLPYSDESAVDPEEALVAALSSCHMLFFIGGAARDGWLIDSYIDNPVGSMEKNAAGKLYVSRITLHPKIVFSGDRQPTREQIDALHHWSHEECYVANSIRAEVLIEPAP
ncbi:MAG TPA: OsmC family protein [Burkholderiales bacterium]|jgi:organic hydroperoxide reductase OsmC/OhrA|nr:OsmC family protein [Burkholderiales bacterium]